MLRYSEIKEQHIYYVDFDPVKGCEFNGKHLAVVVKKNNDKQTAMVLPLTSSSKGDNKINLGKIKELPSNINTLDSYLVLDQLRSVNFSRFSFPIENKKFLYIELEQKLFKRGLNCFLKDMFSKIALDDKLTLFTEISNELKIEKLINLAYRLIKSQEKQEQENIKKEMLILVDKSIDYENILSDIDKNNGILNIIEDIKKIL